MCGRNLHPEGKYHERVEEEAKEEQGVSREQLAATKDRR